MKNTIAYITLLLAIFPSSIFCQIWNDLDGVEILGGGTRQFYIEENTLFIGGVVVEVNEILSTGVFSWNGEEISVFAPGSGGQTYDLTHWNDSLFIVGNFQNVNDVFSTRGIAQYYNELWFGVGGGGGSPTSLPKEIIVFEDQLYVSFGFSKIGPLTGVKAFARWDGSDWYAPESVEGFDNGPRVMCVFDGYLYGGGNFNFSTTGTQLYSVARFDGNQWEDVNGGMSATVQAFLPDEENGILYVAGSGTLAQFGDVSCPNAVAFWDGENWFPVGIYNDINFDIKSLAMYRGQLYAGGAFQIDGNIERVAYFDGVHWHPVPGTSDMDEVVNTIEVYNDELYVGGTFSQIAGLQVPGLARYYLHPDSVQWGVDTTDAVSEIKLSSFRLFPNPTKDKVQVEFEEAANGNLQIINLNGQVVKNASLNGDLQLSIDVSDLSSGNYLVQHVEKGIVRKTVRLVVE